MKRYNIIIISFVLLIFPFSHYIIAKPTDKINSKTQQKFDNELNSLLTKALVLFEKGKYEINEKNANIINEIAVMLKSECFSQKTLAIHGHTDTTGEANGFNNQKLSENRAKAVHNYLLKQCNVSAARIAEVVGWGISRPIKSETSQEEINRSVQFFVDHKGEAYKLDNLISVSHQEEMQKNGLTINKGNNPPKIEGEWIMAANELVFCSAKKFAPGKIFVDSKMAFKYEISNDNPIVIKYESISGKTIKYSSDVRVVGDGNKFTAYFVAEGNKGNIYSKTATIISGEKTDAGIKNINVAFTMIEKENDATDKLMKVGDYRIFKDKDDIALLVSIVSNNEVFNLE